MTRPTPLRAVVFDFDGTLVNSLPLVLESIAHALAPFGGRPTADIFARLGGPPERFLPLLLDDPKHVPEALARMDAFHDANSHLLEVFVGVGAMLDVLRAAGVKAAIWTGRDRASTDRLLRDLQLEGHFAAVICGDDLPTHKPDPEGLREIMRQLDVRPEETLFVGDADVDVLGGRACGVDTILIRHARDIAADIAAQSWRAVTTPAEAYDLVVRRVAKA
jgi:HAD superfamily hydrolase (TIGR01549 family)